MNPDTASSDAEHIEQSAHHELRRWTYTLTAIEETLDTELIEARGRQILYQGLSNDSLVAFVGSGVPMAYGRLSWTQWQNQQLGRIDGHAKLFFECAKARRIWLESIETLLTTLYESELLEKNETTDLLRQAIRARTSTIRNRLNSLKTRSIQLEALHSTFTEMQKDSSSAHAELPPIRFQVAEQLHSLLKASADELIPDNDGPFLSGMMDPFVELTGPMKRPIVAGQPKECHLRPGAPDKDTDFPRNCEKFLKPIGLPLASKPNKWDEILNSATDDFRAVLTASIDYAKLLHPYSLRASFAEAAFPFEDVAKILLIDEVPHGEQILRDGLADGPECGRDRYARGNHIHTGLYQSDNDRDEARDALLERVKTYDIDDLKRDFPRLRDGVGGHDRYAVLGHFKTLALSKLVGARAPGLAGSIGPHIEEDVHEQVRPDWTAICELVRQTNADENFNGPDPSGESSSESVRRQFLSPPHRFVVSMLLALLEDPLVSLTHKPGPGVDKDDPHWSPLTFHEPVKLNDLSRRSSVVAESMDPLRNLAMQLRIRRYLTLNYDFEIERLFEDRTYSDLGATRDKVLGTLPRDATRADGLGGKFVDESFERDYADELTGFAIDKQSADASVFHLHGHAAKNKKLVITERDYMNLYLREDENKETVEEAIRTAFSSSPLMFIGMGMEEADILRPLRQFMSNEATARSRQRAALLPALESSTERAKTSSTLFLRYGVHAVFFGDASIFLHGDTPEEAAFCEGFDWLHRIGTLKWILQEMAKKRHKLLTDVLKWHETFEATQVTPKVTKRMKSLRENPSDPAHNPFLLDDKKEEKLREIDQQLGSHSFKGTNLSALGILLGRRIVEGNTEALVKAIDEASSLAAISFDGDTAQSEKYILPGTPRITPDPRLLSFERQLLLLLLKLELNGTSAAAVELFKKETEWPDDVPPMDMINRPEFRQMVRDNRARQIGLDGMLNGVMSTALTSALNRLEGDWTLWKKRWATSPPHRLARYQRRGVEHSEEGNDKERRKLLQNPDGPVPVPVRYVRHEVEPVITKFRERWKLPLSASAGWLPSPKTKQESEPTGVRSFDHFLLSLQERTRIDLGERASECRLSKGRRYHFVAAARGLGKGSFLSAFSSDIGLAQYIASSWPEKVRSARGYGKASTEHLRWTNVYRPQYLVAFYANLSFSTEISSSFDALIDALVDHAAALRAIHRDDTRLTHREYQDRCAAMRTVLARYQPQKQPKDPKKAKPLLPSGGVSKKEKQDFERWQVEARILVTRLRPLPRAAKLKAILNIVRAASWALEQTVRNVGRAKRISPPRALITVNAVELMFHTQRTQIAAYPKNREIHEFLTLLLSSEMKHVPFDLVLVGNETGMGEPAIRLMRDHASSADALQSTPQDDERPLTFVPMVRRMISLEGIQSVQQRENASRIDFLEKTKPLLTHESRHFEKGFQIDDHPSAHGALEARLPEGVNTNEVCSVYFARVMSPENFLIDNFPTLAQLMYIKTCWDDRELPRHEIEKLPALQKLTGPLDAKPSVDGTLGSQLDRKTDLEDLVIALEALSFKGREEPEKRGNPRPRERSPRTDPREILRARYRNDDAAFQEWKSIRDKLNSNRFLMTILLSAAEAVAFNETRNERNPLSDGADTAPSIDPVIIRSARAAEDFIRKTADFVGAAGMDRREQVVVDRVLDAFELSYSIEEPAEDMPLHHLLLRHLAVIGTPTSLDVLVRAPEIRRYLDDMQGPLDHPRTEILEQAMTSLVRRGLAFRITPHPRLKILKDSYEAVDAKLAEEARTAEKPEAMVRKELERQELRERSQRIGGSIEPQVKTRYTVHRLMQLHVMRKMGAEPYEFGELNAYAPSLFASMAADLPRPSREAYEFLRKLVTSLSQYPDTSMSEQDTQIWIYADAPLTTKVQALRAALSVMRSAFSVAVVSRFDDFAKSGERGLPSARRGFFEEHRVQLRWIIRKAWELLDWIQTKQFDLALYDPDHETGYDQLNACYRDEIVWLYNECGLVCLVQGNLTEGAALLRQALALNSNIEGSQKGGPMHNRVSLNLAVAQIERGRLKGARRRLLDIISDEERSNHSNGRVYALSRGYLGLINHNEGDIKQAALLYNHALERMEAFDDFRACSVFSRHLADVLVRENEHQEARKKLDRAIGAAEAGGHEDELQRARLASLKLERDMHLAKNDGTPPPIRGVLESIRKVERYAETMEMPGLICDALDLRARLLLDQGETTLAGSLAARAMALGKSNDMGLRLNKSMNTYARMLILRGKEEAARRHLKLSGAFAKKCGNQLAIAEAEQLGNGLKEPLSF